MRHLLLVAVSMIVLTGCRLDLVASIDVDARGAGQIEVDLTADPELAAMAESAGVDPLGRAQARIADLAGPWQAEATRPDDGSRSVTIRAPFADPIEFATRWGELTQALEAAEGSLLGPLQLSVTDLEIALDGAVQASVSEVAAADMGTDVATLTQQLAEVVGVALVVDLPGPLLRGTAPTVQPLTDAEDAPVRLTWSPGVGERLEVGVVGQVPQDNPLPLYVGAGVGGAATVLLVIGLARDRRRRR